MIGRRPTVYELNTAVWLRRLGCGLGDVPGTVWDELAALGIDAVWLMGVWERSPAGLAIALADPGLDAGNRSALPDLRPEDVIGSPYCVRDYVVDERFGGPGGLAEARSQLAARGLALILDYVPNHVAPDHPWLTERPGCFLAGTEEDLERDPAAFLRSAGGIYARGRDPYFPPWPDVVQLNAFSPELRDAVAETLAAIGAQCDGLRCDMAMLMTNDVFATTWGERAGPAPREEYWPVVKRGAPELCLIAEVYWDMEWALQQQGFDYCYDKRLYDRLVHGPASAVQDHLRADTDYQERLLRFIENHDEPRATATFEPAPRARAAAVVMSTVPGARLYHDGQFDGNRTHIPVFLARSPDETPDGELREFYLRLLRAVGESGLQDGDWRLCDSTGWHDNHTHRRLVTWCWSGAAGRHLVIVNLGGTPAQGRVRMPWGDLDGRTWELTDRLSGVEFQRDGDELERDGLYVDLGPWASHFLSFDAV